MLTTDEILAEWSKDSEIREDKLHTEACSTNKLHRKYLEIYVKEKKELARLDSAHKKIVRLMSEYYTGRLDKETIDKHKLPPWNLKVLKADLQKYLESDKFIISSTLSVADQQIKVDALERIMWQISDRKKLLATAVEFLRLTALCG